MGATRQGVFSAQSTVKMAIDASEQTLSKLFAPHVESFNYFLNEGLPASVADLDPVYTTLPNQKIVPSSFLRSQCVPMM